MELNIDFQQRKVIGETKFLPAISIILPFHPIIEKKCELENKLMQTIGKIEGELLTHYSAERAIPVIYKLKNTLRSLDYNTHKKSIGIFVSPVVDHVYYLDVEMLEKFVIDDKFEMRDMVLCKKPGIHYLAMVLRGDSSKLFVGNSSNFTLIKSNTSKQNRSNDFIEQMDLGLSMILRSYPLPVFVLGSENVLVHFKKKSVNKKSLVKFIHLNSERDDVTGIQQILLPYELNWNDIKQEYLIKQIEKASEEKRLVTGIHSIMDKARKNTGALLLIEEKYVPSIALKPNEIFNPKHYLTANPFYIKDEVDRIIEEVFISGGDVEYVKENSLNAYGHIVLIEKS